MEMRSLDDKQNIGNIPKIQVAAIQMESKNGQILGNLEKAKILVENAVNQGAQLVLLPEFVATGYKLSAEIWDCGEPFDGPTVHFLREVSAKFNIYIGGSFLEAEEDEFYNTFVLCGPEGTIAGRVRKQYPANFEAYFTAPYEGDHVIVTRIGKIGVSICIESFIPSILQELHNLDVDIVLMPFSAPSPPTDSMFFKKNSLPQYIELFKNAAAYNAKLLGVPTVMTNKCGVWTSTVPGIPDPYTTDFLGFATICDSDGSTLAQVDNNAGETVLVAEVTLDPGKKTQPGKLSIKRKLPGVMTLFSFNECIGNMYYSMSATRRIKAAQISGYDKQLGPDAKIIGMTDANMKAAVKNTATFACVAAAIYIISNRMGQ